TPATIDGNGGGSASTIMGIMELPRQRLHAGDVRTEPGTPGNSTVEVRHPQELLERIAGRQDVAGIAGQGEPVVQVLDVACGNGAGRPQERLVARLQRVAGVQGTGIEGTGRLGPQPAVELDLQA